VEAKKKGAVIGVRMVMAIRDGIKLVMLRLRECLFIIPVRDNNCDEYEGYNYCTAMFI
jgi:hypothetical protein